MCGSDTSVLDNGWTFFGPSIFRGKPTDFVNDPLIFECPFDGEMSTFEDFWIFSEFLDAFSASVAKSSLILDTSVDSASSTSG
jgi:hypothetical protein